MQRAGSPFTGPMHADQEDHSVPDGLSSPEEWQQRRLLTYILILFALCVRYKLSYLVIFMTSTVDLEWRHLPCSSAKHKGPLMCNLPTRDPGSLR